MSADSKYFAVILCLLLGGCAERAVPLDAAKRAPSLTEVDRNALFLASTGEWKKAFGTIENAITSEPRQASHWFTRAKLYIDSNYSSSKAVKDCETALQLAPNWDEPKKLLLEAARQNQRILEEDIRYHRERIAWLEVSLEREENPIQQGELRDEKEKLERNLKEFQHMKELIEKFTMP